MERIDILLTYLREHNWHMTSFPFDYKGIDYIVLFEDLNNLKLDNEGKYDVLLTFVDAQDTDRTLAVKANSIYIKFNVKEFREFFNIEYSSNLGNIFQQFYERFNRYVPETVNTNLTEVEKKLVIKKLNSNDNDNNMCCYALKRNPIVQGVQWHRTIFNAEKCRLLKHDLYEYYENEDTISFCFREENELPTGVIMKNFAEQEERNRRN